MKMISRFILGVFSLVTLVFISSTVFAVSENCDRHKLRPGECERGTSLELTRTVPDWNYDNSRLPTTHTPMQNWYSLRGEETIRLVALDVVRFDFNKSTVPARELAKVEKNVQTLKQNPGLMVLLEGNADAIGSVDYNYDLSQRRAQNVKSYLVSRGIEPERIQTVAKSELEPVAPNTDPYNRQLNRRVEFDIVAILE